jgi:hypothetical protein
LISLLSKQFEGHKIYQIGRSGERRLAGIKDYWFDLPFVELQKKIRDCWFWISGDNFVQHMVYAMPESVKGVVLWGVSDPNLFGYDHNLNILKSTFYLRKHQFMWWNDVKRIDESFEEPQKVMEKIIKFVS